MAPGTESGRKAGPTHPRRWLVVGSSGSGKSRFSLELGRVLGLPVVHLDRHFWRPGWVESPREEWGARVAELCAGDAWVMDGNYSGTLELRLRRAEAVVLMDPPTWQCLHGIYARWVLRGRDHRPDLAAGCREQLPDRGFLWFVLSYRWRSRPKVLGRIAAAPDVHLHRFRSRKDAWAWLAAL